MMNRMARDLRLAAACSIAFAALFAATLLRPAAVEALGPGAAPRSVAIASVHMVTPAVGWALSPHAVLRTMDGGRDWTILRRLPAGGTTGLGLAAIDSVHAWVATSGMGTRVFSTTDGGRRWRVSTILHGYLAPSQGIAFGTPAPSFVDAHHGWTLTSEGAGMEQAQYDVYRTSDGGITWARIAWRARAASPSHSGVPGCDCLEGISFREQTYILEAGDGGRTWVRVRTSLTG